MLDSALPCHPRSLLQSASWFGGGAGAGGGGKAAELGPSLALLRCLQQTRRVFVGRLAGLPACRCCCRCQVAACTQRYRGPCCTFTCSARLPRTLQPSIPPSFAAARAWLRRWAAEEERELAARRLRLAVYLLRDPLFARHTQARLGGAWDCGDAGAGAGRLRVLGRAHRCRRRRRLVLPTLQRSSPSWHCALHHVWPKAGAAPRPPTCAQVALERWVSGTARVPLLGWLSGRAVEILVGVQRYYSYVERMAAS